MDMNKVKEKPFFTAKAAIGYSSAAIADAGPYNFIFMYFLYFLTNIAGVQPAFAGTILLVATCWDMVATPMAAQISDAARFKSGRRRPFMLAAALPMAVLLILLFTDFGFDPSTKKIYFMVMCILFWTVYAIFDVPFYALAAELTDDYEARTKIRLPFIVFNSLANIIGISAPLFLVGYFVSAGATNEKGWTYVAGILAIISVVSIVVCSIATKGKEIPIEKLPPKTPHSSNIAKVYWNIIKLKPTKYLLFFTIGMMLAYNMVTSSCTYYVLYNMGASVDVASKALLAMIIANIALAPVITNFAVKKDRAKTLGICLIICPVLAFVMKAIGVNSLLTLAVFLCVFSIAAGAYWQIVQSLFYDICEIYEYEYGQRMEGAVNSLNMLIVKLGSALAVWLVGVILQIGGYDAMAKTQSDSALSAISSAFTLIPFLLMIIVAIFALKYPFTKERFNLLMQALETKREGRKPTTEGLEKIINTL